MAVEYYSTEFGTFSLVVSDDIFNNISSSNVGTYPPWEDIIVTLAIMGGVNFDQGILGIAQLKCRSVNLQPMYGLPSITSPFANYYYDFASNPARRIRIQGRGSEANVVAYCHFVVDGVGSNYVPSRRAPYGIFGSDSAYGSVANNIEFSCLLCNNDKTLFKTFGMEISSNGKVTFYTHTMDSTLNNILKNFFLGVKPIFVPSPDPYEDAGGGEADLPGDSSLDLPPEPTTSPVDSGLFSLFAPSTAQMRSLADYLWTDFASVSDSIPEMLGEIVEALKRSVSNPLNSIFGLSIIASQGLPTGNSSSVHIGFWDTGISMPRISKQYFTVDCGSLSFEPVCGNTFLDYAPYSKFTIFLPYVGMRILDANDVVGHTISVIYRGDCVSGALVCFIKRDGKIIAEHSGNCALNLPLSADSWANTISSAARIAISGDIAPAMAGLSIGSASGAVKVAAAVATNPSALAPQVGQSGAVAGSSGHMGSQKPFILREAVRFHSTEGFNSIIGYPAFYYRKLGDCHGYTQCLEVHLSHTPCTGVELQEIEDLLKKGVII